VDHGAHQFKFGGSWLSIRRCRTSSARPRRVRLDGTFTGNDFADFLLGDAKSYNELAVQDHGLWNNVSWAAYVQDNWRVNRKLTVNLGLRWDGVPHTYEANNRMGNFYHRFMIQPKQPCSIQTARSMQRARSGDQPNPILAGVLST